MKHLIFIVSLLSITPVFAIGQTITLESLLDGLADAPRTKAFETEANLANTRAQEARHLESWSVFGGVDAGRFQELDATAGRTGYTGYGAQLGLSHPLLGSLKNQVKTTQMEQTAADQAVTEAQLSRGEHRLAVRLAYADWWHAQRLRELCGSHQTMAKQETSIITDRHKNQQLRDSDYQWLVRNWQYHMRGCEQAAARETGARKNLSRLTNQSLSSHQLATVSPLPETLPDAEHWQASLDSHPILSQRYQEWQVARASEEAWYDPIEARVSLSHRVDQRDDISGTGSGWVAAFSFEVPLKRIGQSNNEKQLNQDMTRYRWLDTRNRLHHEIEVSIQDYHARYRDMRTAEEQVSLARLRLWEQRQREDITDDGGFTTLRSLKFDLANAERDYLESKHRAWQSLGQIQLINDFTDNTPLFSTQTRAKSNWQTAVYIWDSQSLLTPETRSQTLKTLKDAGFDTLYIGLSADQLNIPDLEQRLKNTVTEADKLGLHSDLLLGEPLWITEEHRNALSKILSQLSSVNFRALHLDLEVEQLGWPVPDARLQAWLNTLETATNNSPWPISIVAHHRWFSDPEFSRATCIPCKLPGLGIRDVSLMIYTTNSTRIHDLASQAHGHWPELNFQVVQSIEPHLPTKNSWHGLQHDSLTDLMNQWKEQWQHLGISGMAWQAWQYYPGNERSAREE